MYRIIKIIINLLRKLSLYRLQRLAGFVGAIAWYILPERRKVAVINARIIGVEDPEAVAKESFRHTFKSYLETVCALRIDRQFVEAFVTMEGETFFQQVATSGNRYVIISAHMGSWDLSTPVVAELYGLKGIIVGRENNSSLLNRLLEDLRNSKNVAYVTSQGYLEKVGEYEKEGYIPGSLQDHGTTKSDSVIVPFFGYRVPTLAGLAALCARRKIPMLPMYLIRKKDGEGSHLIIHEPIYPDESLKPRQRIEDMAARMNREFEGIITRYPEQWYLLHKRFKRVEEPDGTISHRVYRP